MRLVHFSVLSAWFAKARAGEVRGLSGSSVKGADGPSVERALRVRDQVRGLSGSSVKGADDHEVGASQVSVQGGSLDVIRGPITRDANSKTCLKYRLKIGCDAASVDQSTNAEVCSKITQTLNGAVIVFDDMCSAPGDICRPGEGGTATAETATTVATQSSTCHGGVPSRAIDGNTNGNWLDGSVSHTCLEDNPWFMLDLGMTRFINEVSLYNRQDCCEDRLGNTVVQVLDADMNVVATRPVTNDIDLNSLSFGNVQGRYVKVNKTEYGELNIAELVVESDPVGSRPVGSGTFYPTMEWTTVCSHLNPTWEITHRAPEMEDAFRMFKIYVEERAPDAAEVEATYEFGDPERPELLAGCLGTDAANERFRVNDRLSPNGQCCGSYEFNPFSSGSVSGLECANAIEEGTARPTRSPITDSPTGSPTDFCWPAGYNCGWVDRSSHLEQCALCCGEGAPTVFADWSNPVQHFCGTCLPPNVQCGARGDDERCSNCCYQYYTRDTWAGNRYFCGDESHGTQGPSRSPITASPTSGPTIQCRDDGYQCSDLRDCDYCCSDTRVDNTWDGVQHYCGTCLQAGIECGSPDDDALCSRCCVQYYSFRNWRFARRYACGPETGHEGISDAERILPY